MHNEHLLTTTIDRQMLHYTEKLFQKLTITKLP